MLGGGFPCGLGVGGVLTHKPGVAALTIGPIDAEHEAKAQRLVFAYLRHFGLISQGRNPHATYFGVYTKEKTDLVGVVGEMRSPLDPKEAILTDLYVEPTRTGVQAMSLVLDLYKNLVDNGSLAAVSALVLPKNEAMKRRIARAFSLDEPTTLVYEYRKAAA